jgi:hypothetical protein
VWPATTLAPSFSPLEADVAAQLMPVRGIERSQLRSDWHRYGVSRDRRRIIDARGRSRRSGASLLESDGDTRLSFPSTDPGREVFQPNTAVGLCQGLVPLPARRLRGPCPADRWSSRAPPPFHPGKPALARPGRNSEKWRKTPLVSISGWIIALEAAAPSAPVITALSCSLRLVRAPPKSCLSSGGWGCWPLSRIGPEYLPPPALLPGSPDLALHAVRALTVRRPWPPWGHPPDALGRPILL